jgi:hypothetical protein
MLFAVSMADNIAFLSALSKAKYFKDVHLLNFNINMDTALDVNPVHQGS